MFATAGVPLRRPVDAVNVAQDGRFVTEYVSVSPSASAPVGWKLYAVVASMLVVGVPEIVGARFGAAVTLIVKAGRDALTRPSLTLMTMLENVPAAGVGSARRPVDGVNVAQVGRLVME